MPLVDHLRELRTRVVRALLGIVAGTVLALVFYEPVLNFLVFPYEQIRPELAAQGIDTDLVITGVGGALQFQLKISLIVGILVASPVWLWQLWAFVLPAMHRHEKRWAFLLTGVGAPLFVAGAALAYLILPKAILILIGFVPDDFSSLLTGKDYLDFIVRMMLVFGVAAEIPLVVVLLNRLRIVSGRQLVRARPWIIVGIFIFAAIATPTTDPLTMLFLAAPMTILYLVAEVIARVTDYRRGKAAAVDQVDDDEASAIEAPTPVDDDL